VRQTQNPRRKAGVFCLGARRATKRQGRKCAPALPAFPPSLAVKAVLDSRRGWGEAPRDRSPESASVERTPMHRKQVSLPYKILSPEPSYRCKTAKTPSQPGGGARGHDIVRPIPTPRGARIPRVNLCGRHSAAAEVVQSPSQNPRRKAPPIAVRPQRSPPSVM